MSSQSAPSTVLCFSHDATLLMTRQWMLQREHYLVLGVMSQADFRAEICRGWVDLVLCQSLSEEECRDAVRFAAEHAPAARCAVLRTSHAKALPDGNVVAFEVGNGPDDFLQTITRMLPRGTHAVSAEQAG